MCPLLQRRVSIDQPTVGQPSNEGNARLIMSGFAYQAIRQDCLGTKRGSAKGVNSGHTGGRSQIRPRISVSPRSAASVRTPSLGIRKMVLVTLSTWFYRRDRQQRLRLWMIGRSAILGYFGASLCDSFRLIKPSVGQDLLLRGLLWHHDGFGDGKVRCHQHILRQRRTSRLLEIQDREN